MKTVFMFPQELIDRFVDEVAGGKPTYHISPGVQRELRSCSLAARCFLSRSQRHLLAHARLFIFRGGIQSKRLRKLREILETNDALRQCFIHLTIILQPMNTDDEDVELEFHDGNLPFVMNMLAELRHLDICTNNEAIEWDSLSQGIKTALGNTRFTSPHLSSLLLGGILISPHDLVYTWKSIKEITLRCVGMNTGEGTSQNASMEEFRLEKVRISGHEFPLHLALQNSQILGGLRQFKFSSVEVCPCVIRQIWNVIHIASKSLVDLDLTECFG